MNTVVVDWVRNHMLQLSFVIAGVVMMTVGVAKMAMESRGHTAVISNTDALASESAQIKTVVVDVAGAVENSGVYSLKSGSRIADALSAAGGFSAKADRNYVARFVNQAQVVTDGMKVYIPAEGEHVTEQKESVLGAQTTNGVVSINTASLSELDSLWGVGAARAKQIIDNRPYQSLDELASKAKIPKDVIEKNAGKITI